MLKKFVVGCCLLCLLLSLFGVPAPAQAMKKSEMEMKMEKIKEKLSEVQRNEEEIKKIREEAEKIVSDVDKELIIMKSNLNRGENILDRMEDGNIQDDFDEI